MARIQPRYDWEVSQFGSEEGAREMFHPWAGTKQKRLTWGEWWDLSTDERAAEDAAALARGDSHASLVRRIRIGAVVFAASMYVAAIITTLMVGGWAEAALVAGIPVYFLALYVWYIPEGFSRYTSIEKWGGK
jgi:hypothetical protein